jgi:hypothetical protein
MELSPNRLDFILKSIIEKEHDIQNMRTAISLTMVAAVIAAGFLFLATTSNAAFATGTNSNGGGTSAISTSSISQSNTQSATCTAGTSNEKSYNQLAVNFNAGDAVSAAQASAFGR